MQTRHFVAGALVIAAALASTEPAAPGVRLAAAAAKRRPPVLRAFPAPPAYEEPDLSIPGGGRILIPVGGVRVVRADGTLEYLWTEGELDAVWDPLRPGELLVTTGNWRKPNLRTYRATKSGWKRAGGWAVGSELFYEISPDGRLVAHSVFRKTGGMTGTVRVLNRRGERIWELRTGDLYPVSWTPDGRVLLSDWDNGGLFAWDMGAGTVTTLLLESELLAVLPAGARSPEVDEDVMSWSTDGRYFATRVSWNLGGKWRRYAVAIGSPSGEILDVVKAGKMHPSIPTWSPKRAELAFVTERLMTNTPRPRLYVYDVVTRGRTLLLRGAPDPWWVAWSPRGDWMLLDDWRDGSWLFVSRDGRRTIKRARLGSQPRWASPGADIPTFKC